MSRHVDATTGHPVEVFTFAEPTTIRVDAERLMTSESAEIALHFDASGQRVVAVWLTLRVYRAALVPLVNAGRTPFGLTELARLAPMAPITVRLAGVEALCAPFAPALAAGLALADCLTRPGRHRFPAFFDLENYAVEQVVQPG